MHAERGTGGWGGAAELGVALAALMLLTPGRARALGGHAVVQFQDVRQRVLVTNPDGTTRTVESVRQLWSQTYDVAQSLTPRPDLSVFWQFQLNDISTRGLTLNQRTPYGALRLNHRMAGFSASYRPATTTSGVRGPGGVEQLTTQRRQETMVSAYLSAPEWPRLDLSWQRTHREANGSPAAETGISRSARLAWDRGTVSFHGGYGDVERTSLTLAQVPIQRNLDGGAVWRLGESANRSLTMSYDYAGNRSERGRMDRSQSHTASATGQIRQSQSAQWNFFSNWRRSLIDNGVHTDLTDFESSLFYNLQATRIARLLAGGGTRTVRTETSTGLLNYLSAVASAAGPVRRGWKANGSLSHVTNWEPGRPAYSVETAHGGSRLDVVRRLTLDLDLLLTATSDIAARDARYVVQSSAGLQGSPLRSLTVTLSARRYQAGPALFDGASESRSLGLNVRLRPGSKLDLAADVSSSGSLPHNDPQLRTSRVNATWNASPRLRLSGYYTRSDRTQRIAAATALSGQEIVGARLLAALGRRLNLNAGMNIAEPRGEARSRQGDASLTWSFGGSS
jgi:hypothetical protein